MNHSEILKKYGISAKKSLGQNFLVNDSILDCIAQSMDISGRNIIEIGPGYGALTEKILKQKPKSLTLIELDKTMVSILQSRIAEKNLIIPKEMDFTIVEWDILKYSPWFSEYAIIANIPYYITSPILFRFLYELANKPMEMIILMQKEVADKIRRAKRYKNSYLSLAMEYVTEEIREILTVSKDNFIPIPKVESSVLYFKRKKDYNEDEARRFLQIISAGFVAPRKKLLSNLASKLSLPKEKLSEIFEKLQWKETVRAEEIDIEGWKKCIKLLG